MEKIDRKELAQTQVAGGCCKCSCKTPVTPPGPPVVGGKK